MTNEPDDGTVELPSAKGSDADSAGWSRVKSTKARGKAKSQTPDDPKAPVEPEVAAEPEVAVRSTESSEPAPPDESDAPAQQDESSKSSEPDQPAESSESIEPAQTEAASEADQTAESSEPAQPDQSSKSGEPEHPDEPTESARTDESSEPEQPDDSGAVAEAETVAALPKVSESAAEAETVAALPKVSEPAVDAETVTELPKVPEAPEPPPGGGDETSTPLRDRIRGIPASIPRRRAAIIAGSVVGAAAVLYGVGYVAHGSEIASGATIAGVEVGGMSRADAEAKLEKELPDLLAKPITATVGDKNTTYEIIPADAGLSIDIPATVAATPGGGASPASLWSGFFGEKDVQPVTDVNDDKLRRAIGGIAEDSDIAPVNAAVAFDEGKVVTSKPKTGREIDVGASSDVVSGAFFGDDDARSFPIGDVELHTNTVSPAITEGEVQRAVDEFAEPAMSGPVVVRAEGNSTELSPELIGEALTMEPAGSSLEPKLDGKKLSEVAEDQLSEIGQEGKDATIVIENGEPTVVADELGRGVAPRELRSTVLAALTKTGDARRADVKLTEMDPELTASMAEDLGVNEVVSEFTTYFPYAEYRNTNIGLAAEKIDNTMLKPGDEFSLNDLVGERTAANGFAIGGTINSGVLVEDYGGGVSQVATTTYHAAFKAGLEDVYHKPHSIYFDRYPIAQEATVSWGNFDMSFKNDTPYGVVVDTSFSPSSSGGNGVLTVRLWSTEHYRVESSVSDRYNFTSASRVYNNEPNCLANPAGSQGFSITSYRKVWNPQGKLVKDEEYPVTYNPNPEVICGEEPSPDNDDDDGEVQPNTNRDRVNR